MDGLITIISENPVAAVFGALGLTCQLIWPWFRQRRAILSVQFGIGSLYCVQYALLGAWSAAGVTAIGATQTAVAFAAGDRPWLRRAGLVFLPIVAALCLLTWNGLSSLFALSAVTLIMVGRMQEDTMRLRVLQLAAAPFGMGHDVIVGAAPALIGGVISACVAAAALAREIRLRRHQAAVSAFSGFDAVQRAEPEGSRL